MKINLLGYAQVDFEDKETMKKVRGTNIFICYDDPANDRLVGKCAQRKFLNDNVSRLIDFKACLDQQLCDVEFNQSGKIISMKPFLPDSLK